MKFKRKFQKSFEIQKYFRRSYFTRSLVLLRNVKQLQNLKIFETKIEIILTVIRNFIRFY